MKSTRVCRVCRQPKLISTLSEFMEGSVKRFKCTEPCKRVNSHSTENNSQEEDLNSNTENIDEILEELLEPNQEVEIEEEVKLEVGYNGKECHIESQNDQVFTTCILGEDVNWNFVQSLATFCEHEKATLHIFFKKRYVRDEIDLRDSLDALDDFLVGVDVKFHISEDVHINGMLEVRASANVHHTAVSPLSQVKALASTKYLIIPHARQEIETTISPSRASRSLLMSTGCINSLGKGHTQALAKTKFHSVVGAVVHSPTKREGYGLLALNFDGNGFANMNKYYGVDGRVTTSIVNSVYLDDWHSSLIDLNYQAKVKRLLGLLDPIQVISGDVFDGQSVCYHEQNNVAFASNKMGLVEELNFTKEIIRDLMSQVPSATFVFLGSNHHNFFSKFFSNPSNFKAMCKQDLATSYRALAYMVESTQRTVRGIEYADPMKYFFDDLHREGWFDYTPIENVGIALSHHGCEYNIRKGLGNTSNSKGIYGHTHLPCQIKGNIWVGDAMVENPAYQNGMNGSAHGFATLYESGKRQLCIDL